MTGLRIVDNFTVDLNRALSHSQLSTFDRCKHQYGYKYLKNLKPLARDQHIESWERMNRGILIHAGMESGFLGESVETGVKDCAGGIRANNDLSDAQKVLLESMTADSIAVAIDALEWLPASDWEPVIHEGKPMVEAKLELPLPPWKGFIGYADLVAKHKPTGRVLVVDYKTRERFESDGSDLYNVQFGLYQYALWRSGVRCDGSLLFEIKPVPPKRAPRVIRDDVGGIDGVRISSDGRFRTTPTLRSQAFLEAVWGDTQRKAMSIAKLRPADIYRSLSSFNCGFCDFKQLCLAEANGEDVEDILRENFKGHGLPLSASLSISV